MEDLLERLRNFPAVGLPQTADGALPHSVEQPPARIAWEDWAEADVRFVARPERLEHVWRSAVYRLIRECVVPLGGRPALIEGGVYRGCWLESTGTINAEVASRFMPRVAENTFRLFADFRRDDGLLPYKVTEDGPVYRQVQIVTPLARSVYRHWRLQGGRRDFAEQPDRSHHSDDGRIGRGEGDASGTDDKAFLQDMYEAIVRFDEWLTTRRNTRGTGCVEAFCCFDTGHDMSPRFWHMPDTPHLGDAARFDPDSPFLPFLAPDMTAHTFCQRRYLAKIAEALGLAGEASAWDQAAARTLEALWRHCYDECDGFFYDRDRHGRFVRVQSDVLLRVLACEVGDRAFFDACLSRYLLNTRKFFAKYPPTSLAMDDPRFDRFADRNSWGGPTNFLSLLRAPDAFDLHGRHVEWTWIARPTLAAAVRMTRFSQCLDPWTGEEGFTESYAPAMLCVLDTVERTCGVMPTPEGKLWWTGVLPNSLERGETIAEATAYGRTVDGARFELVVGRDVCTAYRDGERLFEFSYGLRVVTDRSGAPEAIVGMVPRRIEGIVRLWPRSREYRVSVGGNEVWRLEGDRFVRAEAPGVVWPTFE
ncbi:MAG: hypothetical protein BLM47_06650 [Candidatus Reconcilbacillus cellulovorans]|uniref:Mannosylglycerate hydrolase MGH1-like glycoside hydrolase domain-containing protein n=1 Tax=Candidatus Reconcilbacillus cellulovorans TaxID=1906605 RepID=A0A2A6DZR2_9BACL|nr:MAG: hypothetical protein BLM47_06650 [Candidatus Reconcilbacillus cellulovorans]